MERPAEWLRDRIRRLHRLCAITADDLARAAVSELIEEAERRIVAVEKSVT